jgi:hypothetical protein
LGRALTWREDIPRRYLLDGADFLPSPKTPNGTRHDAIKDVLPEVAGVLVFVLVAYWSLHGAMLNHDVSWYLIATAQWIDGAQLGVDIVDPNPPLAYYLTAPAVLLARGIGVPVADAMSIYVLAILFVSVVWFGAIGARSSSMPRLSRRLLIAAICLGLFVLALRDFAQREFFMAMFTLPYLILSSLRPDKKDVSTIERVMIGVFAAIGLALKPYFLLLPAAMVLLEVVRRRSLLPIFEPQNLAIAAVCIAYVVAVFVRHPAYIEDIVPMAWMTYGAYGFSPVAVARVVLPVVLSSLFALYGLARLSGPQFDVGLRFWVAALAGLLIYFLQFKGWIYQFLPATVFALLACMWVSMALIRTRSDWVRGSAIAATAAILLLVPPILRGNYANSFPSILEPYFQDAPGERSFLAMVTNVFISFPMANIAGAEPASRFPALWVIPGAVSRLALETELTSPQRARLEDILAYARQATVDDLARSAPELVIVDARADKSYFQGVAFDYLAFFDGDRRFGPLWQHYRLVGTTHGFEIYRRDG